MATIAALVAVMVVADAAAADSRAAEARFYFERAAQAYRTGRYTQAVAAFSLAYEAAPNPRILFNLARAAERAGRLGLAFSSFESFLASDDGDPSRRRDATRRRDGLARRIAVVNVITEPPGATIYVNRRDRGISGVSPIRIPVLEAGEVTILAEAEGHQRAQGAVDATLSEESEIHLVLQPRVGELVVATTPGDASLELLRTDGAALPIDLREPVPVGEYRLVGRAPEHRDASAIVRVREGERTSIALTLAPVPRPTGRLLVDGPPGREVFVDDRLVGTAPVGVTVPIGGHRVRVAGGPAEGEPVEVTGERVAYVDLR